MRMPFSPFFTDRPKLFHVWNPATRVSIRAAKRIKLGEAPQARVVVSLPQLHQLRHTVVVPARVLPRIRYAIAPTRRALAIRVVTVRVLHRRARVNQRHDRPQPAEQVVVRARADSLVYQLTALFLRHLEELTTKQARTLGMLRAASPFLASVHDVVQEFAGMVRERRVEGLTEWVEGVRRSEQRELRGFAEGLLEDYAAVRAGLTLPESNGPTEGQINRLKLVKRSMYGRGKVDLLRQRVVWRG